MPTKVTFSARIILFGVKFSLSVAFLEHSHLSNSSASELHEEKRVYFGEMCALVLPNVYTCKIYISVN